MSFVPTDDVSYSSTDLSWEKRVMQPLSYVYVILTSQSQLKMFGTSFAVLRSWPCIYQSLYSSGRQTQF